MAWGASSFAQEALNVGVAPLANTGLRTEQDIRVTIANIIRIILGFLGTIAVILMLYGGFLIMTAGGNAEKVQSGRKTLINAAIGLAIILSAYGIVVFVISRLSQATGVGQVPPALRGGAGVGVRYGGVGGDVFTVSDITPRGELKIRNVAVRILFNRFLEPGSIRDRISIKDIASKAEVPGVYNVSANLVEFIPSALCPGSKDKFCFEGNKEFSVTVKEGIVASETKKIQNKAYRTDGEPSEGPAGPSGGLGAGELTSVCRALGVENNCSARFKTGTLVDSLSPQAEIYQPSFGEGIPAGAPGAGVDINFRVEDNVGVSHAKLWIQSVPSKDKAEEAGIYSVSIEPSPALVPDGVILWSTENLPLSTIYSLTVEAWDIDSNAAKSREVQVITRPMHCFNNAVEPDLGEIEAGPPACGGVCGACEGESCRTDFDCVLGTCLNGACSPLPRILEVTPVDGAAGNFVTILGSGFGRDRGKVVFLGKDLPGDESEAVYPSGECSDFWHENYVIVEAPPKAASGGIRIETASGLYDDTKNSRGWAGEFSVNNLKRPGVCRVNPVSREPFEKVSIYGKSFGSRAASEEAKKLVRAGLMSAPVEVWADKLLDKVSIPLLKPGKTFIAVFLDGVSSNRVPFEVVESKTLPRVDSISPNSGPPRQYITLSGVNFGSASGSVEFIGSDGKKTLALVDFPRECGGKYWHNDYVVVKVPPVKLTDAAGEITYQIVLKTSEGRTSNFVTFDVNDRPIIPGVCAIVPDNGPWGIDVKVLGEGFKEFTQNRSKVRFWDNKTGVESRIQSWKAGEAVTSVPGGSVTGPVVLVDREGTQSNRLNFKVGECSKDSCPSGTTCCGNGVCSLTCEVSKPLCVYTWSFSTGLGGEGWPCGGNKDCKCPANPTADNPCLTCSSRGICEALCQSNKDCASGSSCQCQTAQDGKSICVCQDNTPKVIEDSTCRENTQTPSPFKDTRDGCTNVKISARFNVDMDESTFALKGTEADSSIIIKECNSGGDRIDLSNCRMISGELSVINQGQRGEGFTVTPGSLKNPQLLKGDTWHQVIIKGSVRGSISNGHIPMGQDYGWVFKTKDSCIPSKVLVVPPETVFDALSDNQRLSGEAVAANCNLIWIKSPVWTWAALNNAAPYIGINKALGTDGRVIEGSQDVFPVDPLTDTPIGKPAKVEGGLCRQDRDGTLVCPSDLKDTADVIIRSAAKIPSVLIQLDCNINTQSPTPFMNYTEACVNSVISARFSHDMKDEILLDPAKVIVKQCNTGAAFDSSSCGKTVAGQDLNGDGKADRMAKVGNDNGPGEGFVFTPQANLLEKDTWYEVTISGGVNGMKTSDNAPLPENFVWHFKARNSSDLCQISKVLVTPPQATLAARGETKNFMGAAVAANCNILRGNYNWKWGTVNPKDDRRAELFAPQGSGTAAGVVTAEAKLPTTLSSPVHIEGVILPDNKSDTADLYITFVKPRVVSQWPSCQSACLNAAVGGAFNLAMDLKTINSDTVKLFQCADQTCKSLSEIKVNVQGSNASVIEGQGTVFNLFRVDAQSQALQLAANQWYLVSVRGKSNGVKSVEGVMLDGLNYDLDGDKAADHYIWIFKTSDTICKIARVAVNPVAAERFLIGVFQDYDASPYGAPDACNPKGQMINPVVMDWAWLSSQTKVARLNPQDKDPQDSRIDPHQDALTVGPGTTDITAETEGIAGKAQLKVTCGFTNDNECREGDQSMPIADWGVNKANSCCYQRPKVIVPSGSFKGGAMPPNAVAPPDGISYLFPQPAINAGYSPDDPLHPNLTNALAICRNAVIAIQWNQRMNLETLSANAAVAYNNGANPCPKPVSQASYFDRWFGAIRDLRNRLAQAQTENWCLVEGKLNVSNVGNYGMFMFVPSNLLDPSKEYRVMIKGGQLTDDKKNIAGGAASEANISMLGDFGWQFKVKNEICQIEFVDIMVSKNGEKPMMSETDKFSCGLRDDCADDLYSADTGFAMPDNQHKYTPFAKDKNFQILAAGFEWKLDEAGGGPFVSACAYNQSCPYDTVVVGSAERAVNEELADGSAAITPIKNGNAMVSVIARGKYAESGMGSRSIEVDVFLCENPWPNIVTFPWSDTEGQNASNFSLYYCRDAGARGASDDLPAVSKVITVNPPVAPDTIIKDSACPTVADYKCGEDGKTYLNQCVLDKNRVYLLKEGRCDQGLLKEILFFVDVPDNVIRDKDCVGPVDYICGKDGKTYYNRCVAQKYNVEIVRAGKCR